jgi:hypothetical protein
MCWEERVTTVFEGEPVTLERLYVCLETTTSPLALRFGDGSTLTIAVDETAFLAGTGVPEFRCRCCPAQFNPPPDWKGDICDLSCPVCHKPEPYGGHGHLIGTSAAGRYWHLLRRLSEHPDAVEESIPI